MGEGDDFYEGVEKLLEIWFKTSSPKNRGDLRKISRETWQDILKNVKCEIVDSTRNEHQIAYILSESSLFVTRDRVILKTCGTTLCLQAIRHILKLADEKCGLDVVVDCFYSRRNFSRPDQQPFPHTTFEDETLFLDQILPGGASYCLGSMNGSMHGNRWFLWTLNHSGNPLNVGVDRPDQTVEILMTDLHPSVAAHFYKQDPITGKDRTAEEITKVSGIGDLIAGSIINSFQFDPCGYSMNGILKEDQYWTIHITPEDKFSYASFETNVPLQDYAPLIERVMNVFKPGRCCMTLFWNELSNVDTDKWIKGPGPDIAGQKRMNRQLTQLQNYFLLYSDYVATPTPNG